MVSMRGDVNKVTGVAMRAGKASLTEMRVLWRLDAEQTPVVTTKFS